MARLRSRIVRRIREHAARRWIRFTRKALEECVTLGFDAEDMGLVLAHPREEDWAGRLHSEVTGEWMYVFKPYIGNTFVYVKLILREECIVISFHQDRDPPDDDNGDDDD